MPREYDPETKDEFGIPLGEYVAVADQFSDEANDRFERRAITACSNYLYGYGIPTSPAHLLSFTRLLASTLLATAVVDGYIALTDKAKATDEEIAATVADREERMKQAQAGDMLQRLVNATNGQNREPAAAGYGAYL